MFIPRRGDVVLPDDSTTYLNAGAECAACASKCPLGSGSRCPCCSNRVEPGNLAWFFLHSFPDVLTAAQINATYAFDIELIRLFGESFTMPSVPTSSAAPFFSTPPFTAMAAQFGDRERALTLYRRLEQNFTLGPFGITTEYGAHPHADCGHPQCMASGRSYGSYLTNYGQQLQAVLLGFTGLRVTAAADPEAWIKSDVALPAGWESIRVRKLTLAGRDCSVLAQHGKRAELQCADW